MTHVDWKGYRIGAWFVLGALAVLAIVAMARWDWRPAAILAGFLIVTAGAVRFLRTPPVFHLLLALAMLMNAAGWARNLYQPVWGYDEIAHALGTLAFTLLCGWYGYRPIHAILRREVLILALTVFSLGVALGAIWEVLEWLMFKIAPQASVKTLDDEISDLVADGAGALIAVMIFHWALRDRS
ncbi:MAG: hypothetical protein ACREJB_14005 [Planctomycetaceae bacterium]